MVRRLVEADPALWLSRSWTTRPRRPGEAEDAYVWVSEDRFRRRAEAGGFFEWATFLGHLYGTPDDPPPGGRDLLLEIDVQGAEQVKARAPDALVVLLVPPSEAEQESRLRGRGDPEDRIRQRVEAGRAELARGRALADYEVLNDDLERTVAEVAGIIESRRARTRGA